MEGVLEPIIYIDLVNLDEKSAAKKLLAEIAREKARTSKGYPAHYNVEYNYIKNRYYIGLDKIIFNKSINASMVDGGFDALHSKITWFPDEEVTIISKTPQCSIELLDVKDTSNNFNIKFDHILEQEEVVESEFCALLTNKNKHFRDFVSTQIISPVSILTIEVEFAPDYLLKHRVKSIRTQKIFDSLMSSRTEPPEEHCFQNPFRWVLKKPELHFEYQISWQASWADE